MGPLADQPAASSLLEGTLPPNRDLPLQETYQILFDLSTPLALAPQDITTVITSDQFTSTYKIVKEDTSSSFM
jgi:small neutral amino acid transporter SnatA (MarC family)